MVEQQGSTPSPGASPSKPRSHLGAIVVLGALAVVAALGVAAWAHGYFTPKPKVALVTWNDDPYWDPVIRGAEAAAKVKDVDLVVVRGQADVTKQTDRIRELLDQGVQGIAISPNGPSSQEAILTEAAGKVALITFDSDAEIPGRRAFVGTDNYYAGQLCADEVRAAIPDGGGVIISVGSISMQNGRQRRQGLIDDLLGRRRAQTRPADPVDAPLQGDKYSILATVLDDGDPAKATAGVADAVKAHPDVKCIVGLFSYNAPAVLKAIDQAGMKGKIKVIGFDESDATQAGVADGSIYSSILQDQYHCGYATIDYMADVVRHLDTDGPKGVRVVPLTVRVMRADNIADLRRDGLIHTPK